MTLTLTRRTLVAGTAGLLALGTRTAFAELPPLAKKDTYKVGFAQIETNNPWRLAQTASMKAEAERLGYQIVITDSAGSAAKQVADVNSMIAQKVDLIFLPPREEKPLVPAIMAAKKNGIPVVLIDRNVDQKLAKAGEDYITFIGSDFVDEGKRAGEWLTTTMNGKAKILEIEGTVGSSPANDRKKGFDDYVKQHPGMEIVASQSGDFARDKGRQVAETLLQAHPDATAVYAHSDEMALGAIAAIESAGKVPGKDIIVVGIDGERAALEAIIAGKLGATVECNPRFGPAAFQVLQQYAAGDKIPPFIQNQDRFFDASNAKENLDSAF